MPKEIMNKNHFFVVKDNNNNETQFNVRFNNLLSTTKKKQLTGRQPVNGRVKVEVGWKQLCRLANQISVRLADGDFSYTRNITDI